MEINKKKQWIYILFFILIGTNVRSFLFRKTPKDSINEINQDELCPFLHEPSATIWQGLSTRSLINKYGNQTERLLTIKNMNISKPISQCLGSLKFSLLHKIRLILARKCYIAASDAFSMAIINNNSSENENGSLHLDLTVNNMEQLSHIVIQEVVSIFMNNENDKQANRILFMKNITSNSFTTACNYIDNIVSPCLFKAILPIFINQIENTKNTCCHEVNKLFYDSIGMKLTLNNLYKIFSISKDLICANKKIKNTTGTTSNKNNKDNIEKCGYTYLHDLIDKKTNNIFLSDVIKSLLNFPFKAVPNENACDAFNGKIFYDTENNKKQITFNNNNNNDNYNSKNIGCCANYIDNFITLYSNMPIITKNVPTALFAKGQCYEPMKDSYFLNYLKSNHPTLNIAASFLLNECYHIPNNFKERCIYDKNTECSGTYKDNKKDPILPFESNEQYETFSYFKNYTTLPIVANNTKNNDDITNQLSSLFNAFNFEDDDNNANSSEIFNFDNFDNLSDSFAEMFNGAFDGFQDILEEKPEISPRKYNSDTNGKNKKIEIENKSKKSNNKKTNENKSTIKIKITQLYGKEQVINNKENKVVSNLKSNLNKKDGNNKK